jgi:hypothetical protein
MVCRYCDTAYIDGQIPSEKIDKIVTKELMTPNEVREKIALNQVVDFGVTVEEATDRLLALGRCGSYLKNAYDTDGRKICSFTTTFHHN